MTAGEKITSGVLAGYDHIAPLVAEHWGPDLHFGYWHGPADDAGFPAATARLTDLVVGCLGVRPGQRVLDVGCGQGRPAAAIAAGTGAEVVGIDLNSRALAEAAAHAEHAGVAGLVEFRRLDALNLPYPDGWFDAVLAFECTPHFRLSELYPALARVLRPLGRLVIETPYSRRPLDAIARRRAAGFFELLGVSSIDSLTGHLDAFGSDFDPVEFRDITPNVGESFPRLARVLRRRRTELTDRYGIAEAERIIAIFTDWAAVTEIGGMVLIATRRHGPEHHNGEEVS